MDSAQRPKRRWARWTALGTTAVVLVTAGAFGVVYLQARTDTVGDVDFATRMAVPPLAPSTTDSTGTRTFDLAVQEGETRFLEGAATRTWGVNGSFLGPTIRAAKGEKVAFNVRNGVSETTSLHWHGMHLPADVDGGPHQTVEPGATWRPGWTISQQAATLWYHPHLHGKTADHVYRGVAGMFIVDDERTATLGLPGEYGVDDLPLIVQDRAFDGGNQFDRTAPLLSTGGVFGDEILVNGTRGPYVDVSTRLVRLRLLNASTARLYNFGFSDDRPFQLIATDGGLLPKAWETTRLQLTPGERAEIVVAFAPRETVDLRSYPAGTDFNSRMNGAADRLDLVRFRAGENLRAGAEVPQNLGTAPDLADAEIARTRTFELNDRNINGVPMDMNRIDFGVRVGSTEVWEVVNTNGYMHNFHVHDVQFQVLDAGGQPPPPHLAGWKDTVQLEPDRKYRLAMRFSDFSNPDVPYMFHCHLMLHEDEGMMGQFVVLREGEQVGRVNGHQHR